MPHKRIELVPLSGIPTCYPLREKQKLDVSKLGDGAFVVPAMADALLELNKQVIAQNGILQITDLFRPWSLQKKRREDYLSGKKKAYAAPPGGSFHQAARAVDLNVNNLNFKDVPKEKWLSKLWDMIKPLGFRPIVRFPDLGVSECWHFDFPGDWSESYNYSGLFSNDAITPGLIAKCTILDIGKWEGVSEDKMTKMFIQAQLIRLGHYEIGDVDGIIGAKTKAAIVKLGADNESLSVVAEKLMAL